MTETPEIQVVVPSVLQGPLREWLRSRDLYLFPIPVEHDIPTFGIARRSEPGVLCHAIGMAGDPNRRLLLVRHAKAKFPPDMPDEKRPLTKKGKRQARKVGRWIAGHGYIPDVAVVSPSKRTKQTWSKLASQVPGSPTAKFDPRAYHTDPAGLLKIIHGLPDSAHTAMVVSHNPEISELADQLAARPVGSRAKLSKLAMPKFSPATVAVLDFDGDWDDLDPGGAQLSDYIVPGDL